MRFLKKRYNIIDIIFILIGGKLYMDWILPTNPTSKNILFRFMRPFKPGYSANKYNNRYKQSITFITIHLIAAICYFLTPCSLISNILINFYPIIVNSYILIRLQKVINHKKSFADDRKNKSFLCY